MNNHIFLNAIFLISILWLTGCSSSEPADSVYLNGRIYTVDNSNPWAEALAVRGDRIVFVGESEQARKLIGDTTVVTDLEGQMVMPGIHDAHIHFLLAGLQINADCRLPPGATPAVIIKTLRKCAEDQATGDWIVAGSFTAEQFPDAKPDRAFLDAAFPDTPVYLTEFTHHHGLANAKALEVAGIDADTPIPFGGAIPKNSAGELSGELVETAIWLIKQHLPKRTDAANIEAIRWASRKASEFGITSAQEAAATGPALRALNAVDNAGELNQRVAAHLVLKSPMFGGARNEELESLLAERDNYRSAHVEVDFAKMWIDGSPTPPYFTEAGYDDDTSQIQLQNLLVPTEDLNATVTRLDKMGVTTKMHVTGAGAAHAALNAIAAAREANPDSTLSHELGHTNMLIESDLGRFDELNAVAEFSPTIWHLYGPTLGSPPRPAWQFKTVLDRGAMITVGTDWPVTEDPNVFPAVQGMLDRGEESIDLPAALAAMTINGARAVGWDAEQGSIQTGKIANFIVLDRNLFESDTADIADTRVLRTVFEGRIVHSAEQVVANQEQQKDSAMKISIFVTIWSLAMSGADLQQAVLGDALEFLTTTPEVIAIEFYQSQTGDDLPPLHDVPAPTGMLEIRVGSAGAAEQLVESELFRKLLLDKQGYPAPVEKIDLEILEAVHYPIPGQTELPTRTAPLSFVVRYFGPVADHADFVEFYTTNHPPLLAEFPDIRNVLCYLPLGWKDKKEITDESVIIGNEVVFDDLDSLNAALASDALGPVMADSELFADYGNSTHYVMQRELVYQRE